MEKSQSIVNLLKSLVTLRDRVGKITKDAENPFHKSKYATLSHILDHIDPVMEELGVTYVQIPDGENCLTTIITHLESGEFIQGTYNMHPVKSDPQSIGSAITYARRYALGAMLGLNIDDDDDGNAASGKTQGNNQSKVNIQNSGKPANNKPWLNENTQAWKDVLEYLKKGGKIPDVEVKYQISKTNKEKLIAQAL